MDDKQTMKEIAAAVEWWTNCLRNGPHVLSHNEALGPNPDPEGLALSAFAGARMKPVPQEKIDRFHTALTGDLVRLLVIEQHPRISVVLVTDWQPYGILGEACKYADLTALTLQFPTKTAMWFSHEGVKVRIGYGGEHHTIYARE